MKDKTLFDNNDIKAIIDLAKIFKETKEGYKLSIDNSDAIVELIKRDNSISRDEKARLIAEFNLRASNQNAIENLSLQARDIERAKKILSLE